MYTLYTGRLCWCPGELVLIVRFQQGVKLQPQPQAQPLSCSGLVANQCILNTDKGKLLIVTSLFTELNKSVCSLLPKAKTAGI